MGLTVTVTVSNLISLLSSRRSYTHTADPKGDVKHLMGTASFREGEKKLKKEMEKLLQLEESLFDIRESGPRQCAGAGETIDDEEDEDEDDEDDEDEDEGLSGDDESSEPSEESSETGEEGDADDENRDAARSPRDTTGGLVVAIPGPSAPGRGGESTTQRISH